MIIPELDPDTREFIMGQIDSLSNRSTLNINLDKPTKQTFAALILNKFDIPIQSSHFSKGSTVTDKAFRDILDALDIETKGMAKQELAQTLIGVFALNVSSPTSTGSTVTTELWEDLASKLYSLDERRIRTINRKIPREPIADEKLGRDGELFVLDYERKRLTDAGEHELAKSVKDVSTKYWGYDIDSFETSGEPRHIEVKTTRAGVDKPFFLTRNEIMASGLRMNRYWLYRVFDFNRDRGEILCFRGFLEDFVDTEPVTVLAQKKDATQWRAP